MSIEYIFRLLSAAVTEIFGILKAGTGWLKAAVRVRNQLLPHYGLFIT